MDDGKDEDPENSQRTALHLHWLEISGLDLQESWSTWSESGPREYPLHSLQNQMG